MIKWRGFKRGQHCTMHQFCNDWISVDFDDGTAAIVNPLSVELDDDNELVLFLMDNDPGIFWALYEWFVTDDNKVRFKRHS